VRGLGLTKGVSMGYMGCWALEIVGYGKQFNWALIFNLAFTVVTGIAMAQLATWVFWPRRPLQQLPALEAGLCDQLRQQIQRMRHWLDTGGEAPAPLQSKALLPQILQLQELRDQRAGVRTPATVRRRLSSRWAQTGSIWRQLLRQWLLLEPLLLQLPPRPASAPLLQAELRALEAALDSSSAIPPMPAAIDPAGTQNHWLKEAAQLQASPPLLLAIGQQITQLHQLLHSRGLVRQAIGRQEAS
jgi:hypothetical protein